MYIYPKWIHFRGLSGEVPVKFPTIFRIYDPAMLIFRN